MAWFDCAEHRPISRNFTANGTREYRGLALHVQAGNGELRGWFNNPAAQASAHFWVSKAGRIVQYVDTKDRAWAQAAGNPYYASVETEGHPSEALTDAQISGVAKIYAEGHRRHGWPLVVVDSTTAHGLTYHGVGGAAWGGHTGCPGTLRRNQRQAIINRAGALPQASLKACVYALTHREADERKRPAGDRSSVSRMQAGLVAVGCLKPGSYADGIGDQATKDAYQRWQLQLYPGASKKPGGPADGIPGPDSFNRLGSASKKFRPVA